MIWSEIRNDYEELMDEDSINTCIIYIDAWLSDDGDEQGSTIAEVSITWTDQIQKLEEVQVIYHDERAKTDEMAQEVINETIVYLKNRPFSL